MLKVKSSMDTETIAHPTIKVFYDVLNVTSQANPIYNVNDTCIYMDWELRWCEKGNLNTYYKGLVERHTTRIEPQPIHTKKKHFVEIKLCISFVSFSLRENQPHSEHEPWNSQCHKFLISITAHFKENVSACIMRHLTFSQF